MRLQDYINPDLVFTDIVSDDRHDLNEKVIKLVSHHFPQIDTKKLLTDLDSLDSVACAEGDCIIGVPNAFVQELDRTICIVVRVVPAHEQRTRENTRIGFYVLSPPSHSMTHLRLIARITRFACHGGFCDDIVEITSALDLFHRIVQEDQRHV